MAKETFKEALQALLAERDLAVLIKDHDKIFSRRGQQRPRAPLAAKLRILRAFSVLSPNDIETLQRYKALLKAGHKVKLCLHEKGLPIK